MEFLDKIVIPQSPHHIELLEYLMSFTMLIFLPYLALLIGATFMSVMFHKRGLQSSDSNYVRFAKELIDMVTVNKSSAVALGLFPLLSISFAYAQLLQGAAEGVASNLLFALFVLFTAVVSVYTYKYTFYLKHIFSVVEVKDDEKVKAELENFKNSSNNLLLKSGPFALTLLFISSYIVISSIHFGFNSTAWATDRTFISILFTVDAITYFALFLSLSFAIASVGYLYIKFRPSATNQELSDDYLSFVKGISLKTGLLFTLTIPLLYAVNLMSLPKIALSGPLFFSSIILLALLLLSCVLMYFMLKENHLKYRSNLLFLFLIIFAVLVIKDQLAFNTAGQLQFKKLAQNYENYQTEFKASLGIEAVVVSGSDIYGGRCIACHKFDSKLVGPAYKDVLPKYEGKMEDLVTFILNPVKKNPDFPAMPNQGLKPNEAKAVAEYIMETYKK